MYIPSHIISSVRNAIPVYNDWPKTGISYKNTVELAKQPIAFGHAIDWFSLIARQVGAKEIFAADARGFIFGSALAIKAGLPMNVVRKPGKLPGQVWAQSYELEYGTDTLEIQQNLDVDDRPVIIVDDVLATGGTAEAICKLLHNNLGIAYSSMTVAVLINLSFLGGETLLTEQGVNVKGLLNE
jgi:adenine phosphoribosyltransferase